MQDEIKVTQIDREAAAEFLPMADEACGECERGLMRFGEMDDHWLVQAFARHRHQAERDTRGRMEPVGEAGPFAGSDGGFTTAVFHASKVSVGTKLYALPPAPEAGQ